MATPLIGQIIDGFRFKGGDPGAQENWADSSLPPNKGDIVDGYVFKGGDLNSQTSWQEYKAPEVAKVEEKGFLTSVKDDIVKAITPDSKYKSIVAGMDGKVIDSRPAIERKGAPVTDETFNQVKSSYENKTPEKRTELANRNDWVGNVASKVDAQYKNVTQDGVGDNRKEAKINKVMQSSKADLQTATNIVEQGADLGNIATIESGIEDREIIDYAVDTVRSVAKIAPTTGKMATDLLGLGTNYIPVVGDMIMSMGEGFEEAIRYQAEKQSPALQQKSIEMQNIVKNGTSVQLLSFLTANPSVLSDVAIPSLGFMLASGGIGYGVTKVATEKAAANLTAKYAGRNADAIKVLAQRYGRAKGTQAAIATNVGVNAGGAFSEAEGDARTKYTAAAIAGITTLIGNKITHGGAEGAIARGTTGKGTISNLANRGINAGKVAGNEMLQEYTEGSGQALGVQTGEVLFGNRDEINLGQINRQGLLESFAASGPGGVVGLVQGGSGPSTTQRLQAMQEAADNAYENITNPDISIDEAISLAEKSIDVPSVPVNEVLPIITDADLQEQVQEATAAIPAADILEDNNVSDLPSDAATGMAADATQGANNNAQGSMADLSIQPDSAGMGNTPGPSSQSEQRDLSTGNENNPDGALDRPLASATDDFLPKMRSMTTDPTIIAQIDAELELRGVSNLNYENVSAGKIDKEWTAFSPESGTLNIPRADMPQVKAEHRGAMVNFLNARGIGHVQETVPASTLKPTQQEFSEAKVKKAREFVGGDRSILVSSDNHILDGHHQWLSKLDDNSDVDIIRLNAPITQLLEDIKEFPSSTTESGSTAVEPAQQTKEKKQSVAKPKKTTNTLLATLKQLGGIALSEKQDVTGETTGFAPGGYNQIFKKANTRSFKGLIESGDLDDYLPYNMRLESNGMNDEAFDSTEAYDYLADKIRNGERVLPYDVVQELEAIRYQGDAVSDAESVYTEDEINERFRIAANEERESGENARVFNPEGEDGSLASSIGTQEAAQPAVGEVDLLGENAANRQALADAERAKDGKRNSGNDNASEFNLSGSNSEADQAAAAGAQDLLAQPSKAKTEVDKASKALDAAGVTGTEKLNTIAQVRQGNLTAEEVESAHKPNIQDFGQKIGGAKKDTYTRKLEESKEVDVSAEPLSKSWPEPNYQELLDSGTDPWVVSLARASREAIPTKPSKGYKLSMWVKQVDTMRDVTYGLMDGSISITQAKSLMVTAAKNSRDMGGIVDQIELYQLVGHKQSLKGVSINFGEYSVHNGIEYNPRLTLWTVQREIKASALGNWPKELASGKTKQEAIQAFKDAYDSLTIQDAPKQKIASFDIYSYPASTGKKGFFIGKKVGRNYIDLENFATAKEARDYKRDNEADLTAKLEKIKEIPNVRREDNKPRVGEDMRNGQDVTAELFAESFGFKGVEFGNWVEGSKRQKDLNESFDALMDMAAILDIPPKSISLNGELGLAFGARGTGGIDPAKAHYEAGYIVINLTKKDGAGSLGHEWWHALDNYFSRMRNKPGEFMTSPVLDVSLSARGSNYVASGAVRKEMIDAFGSVVRAINQTSLKFRSNKLDAKRTKEYWSTGLEMSARSFESYLIAKLQDNNASNDYLANITDEATWVAGEKLGMDLDNSYPYPTAAEIPAIRGAFDNFFKVIETKEAEGGNIAMFNRKDSTTGTAISSDALNRVIATVTSRQLGGKAVIVAPSFSDLPAPIVAYAKKTGYDNTTERITSVVYQNQIYLVQENIRSELEAEEALMHERIHDVLQSQGKDDLTDAMNELYDRIGRGAGLLRIANKVGYKFDNYRKQGASMKERERIALYVEEFLAGVEGRRAYDKLPARITNAIREFWGKVRAWLQDNGYTNLARKLGADLESFTKSDLAYLLKQVRETAPGGNALDNIRLNRKPIDGNDSKSNNQTDTDAFKKWFGDSKVVDAEERPLVVYHGGHFKADEFSEFDDELTDPGNYMGSGFYFTSDRKDAEHYDYNREHGEPQVLDVYLSMQNPFIVGKSPKIEGFENDAIDGYQAGDDGEHFRAAVQREGYDGIIDPTVRHAFAAENYTPDATHFIAFNSNQIKSAIGNNGNFDATNNDIRFNRNSGGNENLQSVKSKDQSSAAILNSTMVGYLDDSWSNAYEQTDLPNGLANFAEAAEIAYGRKIVGIKPTETRFNQFSGINVNQQIYVNLDSEVSFINITGHEVYHDIKRNRPDLHEWLSDQAKNYYQDFYVYKDKLNALVGKGEQKYNNATAEEELLADFTGDALADPVFLGELAKENPTKFKELLKYVSNWLSDVANKFKKKDLGSSKYFDDVEAMRRNLNKVITAYSLGKTIEEIQAMPGPKFSREPVLSKQDTLQPQWQSIEESKIDNVIRTLQDKYIDLKRVTQEIKKTGADITDRWNAYLQEELYHGRTAKRVQDFIRADLEPLIEDMRMRGVGMAEFEEYLWMRHAPERNAQVAKINEDMPDGGAGVETAEAEAYMESLSTANKRKYEALAVRIDAINKKSRQVLIDYGLESQATINAWQSAYEFYVPLMREDMERGTGNGTGSGFKVKGSSSKRAMGSNRAVVDIVAHIAQRYESNVIRGEKNRVATAMIGLAKLNPNKDFWNVETPPTIRHVSKATGLVETRTDPNYKNRPNVLVARILNKRGEVVERSVTFNEFDDRAMKLVLSLNNLDIDQVSALTNFMGKITRYFSSINTQYNPIFGIVNITRDTQGAILNLSTTDIAGKQKEVLANIMPALRGIYAETRADSGIKKPLQFGAFTSAQKSKVQDMRALWEEYQLEGGTTGFRDMYANSEERTRSISKALDPEWWTKTLVGKVVSINGVLTITESALKDKAIKPVFEWLSDYNQTLENAVRLAAYKVALDSGLSKQQAASLGKNLTVNFNRKGTATRTMGSWYAFFNAAVQGTARIGETLTGPKGKQIIAGGVSIGIIQALLLAAMGFDEDEPPKFVRSNNFIIPLPGTDKKYVTIPMPLGFNILPNFGRISTELALRGGENATDSVFEMFGAVMESFNPLGGNGRIDSMVMPTALDPFNDLSKNEDWTGRNIAQEDFSNLRPTPGYTRTRDKATSISIELARWINNLSGGDDYEKGNLSPTGDQIEYLVGQVTGGIGREIVKTIGTVESIVTGEDLPTYKIPLVGRFYGDSGGQAPQSGKFYNNLIKINAIENGLKGRYKDGKDIDAFVKENPEVNYIDYGKKAYSAISKLRAYKRDLVEDGSSKNEVKLIDDEITSIMTEFNKSVKEIGSDK